MAEDRDSQDRRGFPRIQKLNLVHMSRFDEEGFRADLTAGRTLDVSPGGMRLELYHPVPLRSVLSLSLALEDRIIDVSGEVVYLEALDDERCAVGIRFDDLSDEARSLVRDYVASVSEPD